MGQGESSHKVDYLLEKEKLIQQYSGIDINSISAPSSIVSSPRVSPRHSLQQKQNLWDKEDYRTFIKPGKDSGGLPNDSHSSGFKNYKKYGGGGSLKVHKHKHFIEQDTSRAQNAGRKTKGDDTEPLLGDRSSSDKIFAEHAEYANVLLNAPYVFKTSFASVENVAFKRSNSAGDVSVANSKAGSTTGHFLHNTEQDRLVNNNLNSSGDTFKKPVLREDTYAISTERESTEQIHSVVDRKADSKTPYSETTTGEGTILTKSEDLGSQHSLNGGEVTTQKQSRVDALREKFEEQSKTSVPNSVKKSSVSASKSVAIAEAHPERSGPDHYRRRLSIDGVADRKNSKAQKEHQALTRKNAVSVDVGTELNTETTESVKPSSDCQTGGSSLTESQEPTPQDGSYTESSVFNGNLEHTGNNRINLHKTVLVPSRLEVICGSESPRKTTAETVVEVPSVSKVTINSTRKADKELGYGHLLEPLHSNNSGGDLEYANSVVNGTEKDKSKSYGKGVNDEEDSSTSSVHKPVRVQSLRRKFESILLQQRDKASSKEAHGKLEEKRELTSRNYLTSDPLFEIQKYPVLKSRSDSQIKLVVDKEHRTVHGHGRFGRSKEEADLVYDDTLVRNPPALSRKSLRTQVKRIHIPPDRQSEVVTVAGNGQRTAHFKKRDIIVNKDNQSIPVEEHLYEEYTVKIPPTDPNNVSLPLNKKHQKRNRTEVFSKLHHTKSDYHIEDSSVAKQAHKKTKTAAKSSLITNKHHHQQRSTNPAPPPSVARQPGESADILLPTVKSRQHRSHSVELLSGDCITAEQQQETKGASEKKPCVTKHPPQTHATESSSMDFKRSKKDSKRHRRKSDSSTSNLSDSSTQQVKSSKKWKKSSKHSKDKSMKKVLVNHEENEDPALSQQWGSMINEYQDKYVTDERGRRTRVARDGPQHRVSRINNMDQYNNVRQVFNRGMVLPVKRAPPGLSAQEVESESGATDYSTHSWTAVHRPVGFKAHMDGAEYNGGGGQTYVKEHIDDSFSSSVGGMQVDHHAARHGNRARISSQSSQYTSDIPLSPGRQRKVLANDINHHQHYSDAALHRSVTPEAYHHSRITRYHSDYPSSPEVPRRVRLARQYVSYNSDGGAMSPTLVRRFRQSSVPPREHVYISNGSDGGHMRERSVSRERLEYGGSLQRPIRLQQQQQQQRYGNSRSLSRDRLDSNMGRHRKVNARSMSTDALDYVYHPVPPHLDQRVRERSISREYIDHNEAPLSPASHRKKLVQFDRKNYKKKKRIDEKAKGFVDDVIDEAMDMFSLSPRSKHKSKSREKITSSKNHSQKNVVHTTNIYNEYVEEDSPEFEEGGRHLDRRAFSDIEDYRSYSHEGQAIDDFEQDLRSLREIQQRKPSVLRPQPISGSLGAEKRSCIRPIAGSGITRDGSAPPPKSAYKNYDFELSVGPNQYSAEEKRKRNNSHQYVSDSEFSTLDIRNRKKSSYPHMKFGPAKAKSEDNLLSDMPKPAAVMTNVHVPHQQQFRPMTQQLKSSKSGVQYDSDIEDKRNIDPPTLTRGMVTKILHKLEDDVNQLSSLKAKPKRREKVEVDTFQNDVNLTTSTWPKKDALHTPRSQTSQVGATLYGTLPVDKAVHPTEQKPYSTYLPLLNDSTGPLLTSSPVNPNVQNANTPKIGISPSVGQTDYTDQSGSLAHTRFKMYHGDHVKIQPGDEQSKSLQMTAEHHVDHRNEGKENEGSSYGVFSNENMIVADLASKNQESRRPSQTTDKYHVRKIGQLYSTQPDISMNKQQTLNFYLFNQVKSQEGDNAMLTPQVNYMARNVEYTNMGKTEQQGDIFVNEATLPQTETELREYLIHHKQTQTPAANSSKQQSKSRKVKNYTTVRQQHLPPQKEPKKHTEITHYVTKEREIEKLPPAKQMKETSIQTDHTEEAVVQHYEEPEYGVEERSFSPEQEFLSEQVVEQHRTTMSTPRVGKEIPIQKEQDWNTTFKERLDSEYRQEYLPLVEVESHRMEVATKSEEEDEDDDETVILETYEIEEKEQRIAMAIFEEVEFSHQRTEGGKTVSVGGIDNTSEIPIFWEPDKFEGVVDKRKKKMVQVNVTDQTAEDKQSKHPKDSLALEEGRRPLKYTDHHQLTDPKPMSVQEERKINSSSKPDISKALSENIAALDKVIEDEMAKDEQGMDDPDTSNKKFEKVAKTGEDGMPVTETRTSYNKQVHLDRYSPDIFQHNKNTKVPIYSAVPYEKASVTAIETSMNPYTRTSHFYGPDSEYIASSRLAGRSSLPSIPQKTPDINERIRKDRRPRRSSYVQRDQRMDNRKSHMPSMTSHGIIPSKVEPSNVSFTESSVLQRQSSFQPQEPKATEPLPYKVPPAFSSLQGATVHSEQSQPSYETHFEKDADGNTVKVTEWQHKLSKTVEYPEEEQQEEKVNHTMNALPEAGYINMNLHEGIMTSGIASENDTDTETMNGHILTKNLGSRMANRDHTDVVEETDVGLKPYHFESKESTMKVSEDTDGPKERQFLYDIKKAKLKPIPRGYRNGWGRKQTYGTMSTHL